MFRCSCAAGADDLVKSTSDVASQRHSGVVDRMTKAGDTVTPDTMTPGTDHGLAAHGDAVDPAERLSGNVSETRRGRWSHGRRWWPVIVCIAAYAGLAMLEFGHLSSLGPDHMAEQRGVDQIVQIWWIEWAYYALIHGHNPLFTDWQNYPVGFNAGVQASMLVLGWLASPITFLFGPVVSWNLLERVAPLVSALSMCLVLRRWTRWWPAAFVGGLLYGFSCYMTTPGAHLFLAFVPLPPLFFLLLHEALVRQRWRPKRTGALLGLVCAAQYFISAEIFASMVLMGTIATVLWVLANRKHISVNKLYLRTTSICAVLVGAVLLVYPILLTLFGPEHINGVPNPPAALATQHGDLLGLLVPGYLQRLAIPGLVFSSYLLNSKMMYLGIPLVVAIGVIVVLLRRCGIVRLAGAMTLISLILSLGSTLYIGGHDTHLPLPFIVLANLPLTQGFASTRFSLYTILFGSAIVAIGIDALYQRLVTSRYLGRFTMRRRAIAAIGVSMTIALIVALPTLPLHQQPTSATDASPLFSTLEASKNILDGSAVLAYPYPGNPVFPGNILGFSYSSRYQSVNDVLLDQAVSGMHFRLIGGFGWRPSGTTYGTPDSSVLRPQSVRDLFDFEFYGVTTRSGQAEDLVTSNLSADLRQFVEKYDVDTVVVLPVGQHPATVVQFLTSAIGEPSHVKGATVWFDVKRRLQTVALGARPPLVVAPPVTHVVRLANNEQLKGRQYLVATASADLGVKKVVFHITGEGRTLVETAVTFPYGWLGKWNTTTVANGTYTVRSVAYGDTGQVTTSAGVAVRVRN